MNDYLDPFPRYEPTNPEEEGAINNLCARDSRSGLKMTSSIELRLRAEMRRVRELMDCIDGEPLKSKKCDREAYEKFEVCLANHDWRGADYSEIKNEAVFRAYCRNAIKD